MNLRTELVRFYIHNLYGYKNIELTFNKKNTIVIAENGAGKTTLINSLKSTLKGELEELRRLKCEYIQLDFIDKKYVINISELSYSAFICSEGVPSKFKILTRSMESKGVEDLIAQINSRDFGKIKALSMYNNIYINSPYSHSEIEEIIRETKTALKHFYRNSSSASNVASSVLDEIKARMIDVDVIYLPTYRRIEKSTLRDEFGIKEAERFVMQDGEVVRVKNYESVYGMEFGLYDVEGKLKEISASIERKSSLGYRVLSANIIEDIMTGKIEKSYKNKLPKIDDLSRFLSRVVKKDKEGNQKIIEEVTRIMGQTDKLQSTPMLGYFLSKLNGVIDSTKEMESKIESFVTICNKYLQLSDDSKSLNFDIETLQVIVKDVYTDKPIELEDLSSGEKQIISLMAHMYLDHTKKKIVLIDEPELSLSIEWQEHVLKDIANSPSISQLFAITHSPFIFNNELKSDVKSLSVHKTPVGK